MRWSRETWNAAWGEKDGPTPYIPLDQCVKGHIYRIWSRNLFYGVFDGERGFIGIREKFGKRFLFTEYHWDHQPFATAKPLEDMGEIAESMSNRLHYGNTELFNFLDTHFPSPYDEGRRKETHDQGEAEDG